MSPDALEFGLLLRRLASRWRLFLVNGLAAGALMYGITWLLPSWYRSTAVMLPPEETEQLDAGLPVQRFLSRMPTLAGLSNYYTPSDVYKAILSSRTVQEEVVRRLDLMAVYKQKSMEKALRAFRQHVRIVLAPDGTIAVSAEDRSRERAAAIANGLVEELDRFNVERRNFTARRTRQFLVHRVAEMDSLSLRADRLLQEYQERHHVVTAVAPEDADTRPIADLMAKKIDLEVELGILRSYLRDDNERVVQARVELERVKDQIARLPRLETELARLTRDARLYQQAYSMLSVQLEDARIRETMDTPTLTVLDPAVPVEKRARPIRSVWTLAAMVTAVVASALWTERPRRTGADAQA